MAVCDLIPSPGVWMRAHKDRHLLSVVLDLLAKLGKLEDIDANAIADESGVNEGWIDLNDRLPFG